METFDPFQIFALEDVVRIGIALIILFAGILSVIFVIWGGFLMILSGWNEEKIKPAVNHIRHAIIGVIFLVATLFMFPTLMDLMGVPYGDYLRPRAVLDTIGWLSDRVFGTTIQTGDFSDTPTDTLTPDFTQIP